MNSLWSIVKERSFGDQFGRREAEVACRSLGFTTGAQLLVGDSSPFPAPSSAPGLVNEITCGGSESSLAECNIDVNDYDFGYGDDYGSDLARRSAALICTSPSGEMLRLLRSLLFHRSYCSCSTEERFVTRLRQGPFTCQQHAIIRQ